MNQGPRWDCLIEVENLLTLSLKGTSNPVQMAGTFNSAKYFSVVISKRIMITLSCCHDNLLSYFFLENFTHWFKGDWSSLYTLISLKVIKNTSEIGVFGFHISSP
jgi:hypothetical protein